MTSTVAPVSDNIENQDGGIPNMIIERQQSETQGKREGKVPKRILHFSDGTIEEYSTEDDDDDEIEPIFKKKTSREVNAVNPATLTWVPWIFYQTSFIGNKALAVCDFFGEYLASFFGIISPKYEYEIEHYKKMIEEEKEKKKQDLELGGWANQAKTDVVVSEQQKYLERCSSSLQWTHDVSQTQQV